MTEQEFHHKVLTEIGELKVMIARLEEQMKVVQLSRREARGAFLTALVAIGLMFVETFLKR